MLLSKTKVRYKLIIENEYSPIADKPIIFACNHSAFPDIPLALRAIKKHCYTLIGKQNLAFADRVFFFLSGAIWVDRKSKENTGFTKECLVEYLKKGKSILWFPEATWNLTDNLLMLPMRWGIIEVAKMADAQIIPMSLEYDRKSKKCSVRFGEAIDSQNFLSKEQGIECLRNSLASLRWEAISNNKENRAKISVEEQREELFKAVTDYPPLDWNYEKSCIYNLPNVVEYREAFEHLENIKPNKNNAFLFNKRLI
jgi:1-acyl-sn-glycerol-3-phosphate acyltransferase